MSHLSLNQLCVTFFIDNTPTICYHISNYYLPDNMDTNQKWYSNSLVIIASLIFLFPLGLYLMWKYTQWPKSVKWAITAVVACFILVAGLTDNSSQQSIGKSEAITKTPNRTYITQAQTTQLNASVEGNANVITITNNGKDHMTVCHLNLNSGIIDSGYEYTLGYIESETSETILYSDFVKGDGTRFSFANTKPEQLTIICEDVGGKRGSAVYSLR